MKNTTYDFIIIGGGMVGAAMACGLQNNYKVALIDAAPSLSTNDHRLIALNHPSFCLLQNLNLTDSLFSSSAAIDEIHISHRGHFGITRLDKRDVALPFLGQVIPAQDITIALYQSLKNISFIRPATLISLKQDSEKVTIQINHQENIEELSAKILIGTDGTHSTVRKLINISTQTIDYCQTALVTTTELTRAHYHIAYERFQSQGAIAMLPLPGQRVATIWTDSHDNIAHLMTLSDDEFLTQLQNAFGYRLGKLKSISARYTYPIVMHYAREKVKQRVLLLGNAAHTLHPIAAQGFNLALFEIAELITIFKNNLDAIGSLQNFSVKQQKLSLNLSHYLSFLFSCDFLPVNSMRTLSMISLDILPPLKKYFIRKTLGI